MGIEYRSTRSNAAPIQSKEAILRGIAPDGGLYVPTSLPHFDPNDPSLRGLSYQDLAFRILSPFLPDFSEAELRASVDAAYPGKFDTKDICPVREAGGYHFLELWHGATSAFKDLALSLMPGLLSVAAESCAKGEEIIILTATSGDTGKAALEAFADKKGIRILVYYPSTGVSAIQRKQMTSQAGANVGVAGIDGNFDDAQKGVKSIFTDKDIEKKLADRGIRLSSANSINIARLLPQIVYYWRAYLTLLESGSINPGAQLEIVVPTGNFGNILAAYYARATGLPVSSLVCASNDNRVLTDFFESMCYDTDRSFIVTSSPSMDILVSSNLERLLFHASGEKSDIVAELMHSLGGKGYYKISQTLRNGMNVFKAGYATQADSHKAIAALWKESKYLVDTHTAVGLAVAKQMGLKSTKDRPVLIASTASPYKFPVAVCEALGIGTEGEDDFGALDRLAKATDFSVPSRIAELKSLEEKHTKVFPRAEIQKAFWEFVG